MKSKIFSIIQNNIHRISSITPFEKKGLEKIIACRTEPVPHVFQVCDTCHNIHPVMKSCKHRLCPICGGADRLKWLAKREAELLPLNYFLLTFTIPQELRPIFLSNKKICYNLLFKSTSRVLLKSVENNNRSMKGKAGFFSVLHTHDQRINFHPHIHIVIPGGCLAPDKTKWNHSYKYFFLPVKKLSGHFKDKLLSYLKKEYKAKKLSIPNKIEDFEKLLLKLKTIKWVVNTQAPGKGKRNPQMLLRYLSRYVNKTAISDDRIKKVEGNKVHIEYFDRKRKKKKTEIISQEIFLKRLVLHFLPKGFKRVRFYGFMANRHRANMLVLCRMLLGNSIAEQEEDKFLLDDAVFLFWKYFNVDIALCSECRQGHVSIVNLREKGG